MIEKIILNGFKSFLYRELRLNQLTVLTGLNSSGKSSVFQALLMLQKGASNESSVLLEDHGSVEEIKNKYTKDDLSLTISDSNDNLFSLNLSKILKNEDFIFPELIHISANRFGPQSSIPIFNEEYRKRKIGKNGENMLQCISFLENEPLNEILRHPNSEGDTLLFNIRGWLSVISPNVKFDYKIVKKSDSSYATFNGHRSTNVGFGLSYTLSVITALLTSTLEKNSVLLIENPEAHLHPKGQTELGKLIALCAKVGTQVMVETHSDHLIDGIRIFAKNDKDDFSDNIQFHFFELDKDYNTKVTSPIIDNNGRIDEWPEGFFDQFEINAAQLM